MAAPEKLGKYRVLREIGRGSSAVVYLCEDPFSSREVAIKLFETESMGSQGTPGLQRKLFFNEARTAGRLNHPSILPILDAGEEDGLRYLVMEYLRDARPVTAFCRQDTLLPVSDVVQLVFKCARALDYAHRQGVVHRDIKPSNLLLTGDGDLYICDFGIALTTGGDHETTDIEGVLGSPSYMSPEQVRGEKVNNQSDLFSLGVVMYELLTGRRPFHGNNLSRLVYRILEDEPARPSEFRNDMPAVLDDVVMKALDKELATRYATGLDFAAGLTQAFKQLEQLADEVAEQERFNAVRGLKFFEEFSYAEIWELLRASAWRRFADGDRIIDEGEIDDRFYIIVSGTVEVLQGSRKVARLATGDVFGEMAMLGSGQRTASIQAAGPVDALEVRAVLVDRTSMPTQLRFHRVFTRTLIERLTRGKG